MSSEPSWGVVSTIKATRDDILNFAAHYLDLGARRVHIYLDEDQREARHALIAHPKCRVTLTDERYWKRRRRHKGRPNGHQHRQHMNATHCYNRDPQVDWLLHADVDEFLVPQSPLVGQLRSVPDHAISARVRPLEAMQPDPNDPPPPGQLWCKGFEPILKLRKSQTRKIYPKFGLHLNGGFVSHVAGKVFVRTGIEHIMIRIHSAFLNKVKDPHPFDLNDSKLVHLHAHTWENWHARFQYRLAHGSYRPDLKGAAGHNIAAMTMHELFSMIETRGGALALKEFYDEVCVATLKLRERLEKFGHLHVAALELDAKRARHFSKFA